MRDHPYSGANTRRNMVAFLVGKVPTAILTATLLGMAARYLTAHEFGRYVVCMAMLEITLGFSMFGLDWVIHRFAPVYRLHSTRRKLLTLITTVATLRLLVLLVVASGMVALYYQFPQALGELPVDLIWQFCPLLLIEGTMRIFRENSLEALSLQKRLQFIMGTKSVLLIAALVFMASQGSATARSMLLAETVASCVCLVLAVTSLVRALRAMAPADPAWQPPGIARMREVAMLNFGSGIVEYLFSPAFLILVLGRFQAPAMVAGVGFVLRLVDIIRNYLPGMLVFSLVRSRMIGRYAQDRNFDDLRMWAQFLFKISLLTLLPVCGIAVLYGKEMLDFASSYRYGEFSLLFAVLTFWLALRLHRLVLAVVFNATDMMRLWARSCMYSLLVLVPLLLVGADKMGVWFVPAALMSGELSINVLALRAMNKHGREWRTHWPWIIRAMAALGAGCAVAALIPRGGVAWLVAGVTLLSLVYIACVLLLRVVDRADRQLINRSSGRTVFKNV